MYNIFLFKFVMIVVETTISFADKIRIKRNNSIRDKYLLDMVKSLILVGFVVVLMLSHSTSL